MESTILKKIPLDNGFTLVLEDLSRKINPDDYVVILCASISIDIHKDLFSPRELENIFYDDIIDKLGHRVKYEYKMKRNMIRGHQKDQTLESLCQAFLDNLGQYVGKQNFPGKLILKKYRDMFK